MHIGMISKKDSAIIVKSMAPESGLLVLERGCNGHLVNMDYFFQNLLLYNQVYSKET